MLSIDTLNPADAAALLSRLADRPDLGPDADATAEIARLCGYLPLAIGMLGQAAETPPGPWRPGSGGRSGLGA